MKVRNNEVKKITENLDWLIKIYKKKHPEPKRDWRTYEQRAAYRLKQAMKWFEPLIDKAVETLSVSNANNAGRKPSLSLKQKVTLILIKHLFDKSNREMSVMLVMFSLLNNIDVSYKSIERLYSDEEVQLALHNLHMLILQKKEIKESDSCGDGTGYSLTIKKNYATTVQKHKDKAKNADKLKKELQKTNPDKATKKKLKRKRIFIYNFALMDLKTRMYLAYGTSFKSERKAYDKAIEMAQNTNIKLNSIRLDRYYSAQKYVKELTDTFKDITIYLIPKTNATIEGCWNWKRTLARMTKNFTTYLEEYFQRNQSESAFSEDKRRFGWKIQQRKTNTINTAQFLTIIWHNLL